MSKRNKAKPSSQEPAPSPKSATAPRAPSSGFLHDFWIVPLIFAVVFVSFLPSLRNGFVGWDDSGMFLENVDYRGLKWPNIQWMFTTFHYAHYHPITWLTLGLDYELWFKGPNPVESLARGMHLTSLIIHAFNAVVLYFLIRVLLKVAQASSSSGQGGNQLSQNVNSSSSLVLALCCAVGALAFAIHPLRVESVAWATERRDVVSGLFYLLTLKAYIRAQTSPTRKGWLALSVIFFLLSFLSKAWGITLPFVLLVLDVYPLHRITFGEKLLPQIKKLALEKIPFLVIAVVLAIVAYKGQAQWGIESENLSFLKRLAISAHGFCFYLWKTIWPLNLSPLYGLPRELNPFDLKFLGCGGALVAVTSGLYIFRKRWPWALAAWLCYGLIVSPVIGLTQKGDQIAADRYTYLCLLPLAVLVAAGLFRLCKNVKSDLADSLSPSGRGEGWGEGSHPKAATNTPHPGPLPTRSSRGEGENAAVSKCAPAAAALLALMALAALSFLTFQQTKIWRDDFALWQKALEVEPNNAIAHNGRGRILMERGDLAAAMTDFNEAIRLNPKIVSARNNRGMVHYNQGNLDAALEDFNAALKIKPQHEIYNNTGAIREVRGDWKGAIKDYSFAIQFNPKYSVGYFNRARARKHEGDFDGALADYTASLKWDPLYAEAYFRRGDLLAQHYDAAKAVPDYETALKFAPANWNYRNEVQQRLAQIRSKTK